MSHCLACSYTVANLEDPDPLVTIPSFMKEKKWKHIIDDMATKVDESSEPSESTLKPKCGQPSAKKKPTRIIALKMGKEPVGSVAGMEDPKPVTVRGKVLPPRSP